MSNNKLKKTFVIIYDIFFFAVIIAMLGSAFIFFVSDKTDKSFYGYRFYEVLTNSMKKTEKTQEGNFIAGDMIIVKVEKPGKIKVGDIITFMPNTQSPDTYLTHRVKRIEEEVIDSNQEAQDKKKSSRVFITQGDANNQEDPPTKAENVIGVVKFPIPKAAKLMNVIRKSPVASAIAIISFLLLLSLIKGYYSEKKKQEQKKEQKKISNKKRKKKSSSKSHREGKSQHSGSQPRKSNKKQKNVHKRKK